MVNHGIGVDALNQVSFVPADITANNIVAISATPGTENKTYHVVRDDYANMLDITSLITKATGGQFEVFSLPDFVPELIRRCRRKICCFHCWISWLNWWITSRRWSSNATKVPAIRPPGCFRMGQARSSLEETVNGILKFMHRKGIISVAAREFNAVASR